MKTNFAIGWQLTYLKRLIEQEPWLLYTSKIDDWLHSSGAERIEDGMTPMEIFRQLQNDSDQAYEARWWQ